MLKIIVTCFIATYLSAILFETPTKSAIVASSVSALGYAVYTMLGSYIPDVAAYYIGTLCIVLLCELFARKIKAPATTMLFPALIALVPGIGLYKMMYALAAGNSSYAIDTGMHALMIAGCMALAIATGRMLMIFYDKLSKYFITAQS